MEAIRRCCALVTQPPSFSWPGILVLAILLPPVGGAARCAGAEPSDLRSSSSRAAQDDALRSIPFEKLSPESRGRIDRVTSNVSLFRRMPVRVIPCHHDMYLFLVEHPDVMVNIWETLHLSQMRMRQTGPRLYDVDDGVGSTGRMEYLYSSPDMHIVYVEGSCSSPLFAKPAQGRTLLVLKSGYITQPHGDRYVTCRLDAFIQIDHGGVELLTKAVQPVVGRIADLNFVQTAAFAGSLSRTAEVNPPGMQRLAERLTSIDPAVRQQFMEIAARIASEPQPVLAGSIAEDSPPLVAQQPGAPQTR